MHFFEVGKRFTIPSEIKLPLKESLKNVQNSLERIQLQHSKKLTHIQNDHAMKINNKNVHIKKLQSVYKTHCKASEKLACSEILLTNDKKMLEYQIKEMTEIQNIQESKIQSNNDLLNLMIEKRNEAQRELRESKKRAVVTLKFALQRKRELSECKKRIVFLSEQLEDRESELQQIQHQLFAKDNTLPMQNECTKVEDSGLR